MSKKSNSRAAQGAGTIRKKTIIKNKKRYVYWEARVTVGRDPGTGKQIQRSFSGKTQKEVREKMQAAAVAVNENRYKEPSKMTVAEWLSIWEKEYLHNVKPFTVVSYKGHIKNHIKPALGAIRLDTLAPHTIQEFYNDLGKTKSDRQGLSPKTIKNIHGVLHKALQQAVENQYIGFNPTSVCKLPRVERKEIHPLDENQILDFLEAIKGHRYENLYIVALFTGMREGEVLGLTWECVDLNRGIIRIDRQLQREKHKGGRYIFAPLKNDKARTITLAPFLVQLLRAHRVKQSRARLQAGELWEDSGLVFTNEFGRHLAIHTVYKDFKMIVKIIGIPEARFHDLRHSYAVAAIRAGDDIKTVQGNLGHATAAFTLDVCRNG